MTKQALFHNPFNTPPTPKKISQTPKISRPNTTITTKIDHSPTSSQPNISNSPEMGCASSKEAATTEPQALSEMVRGPGTALDWECCFCGKHGVSFFLRSMINRNSLIECSSVSPIPRSDKCVATAGMRSARTGAERLP